MQYQGRSKLPLNPKLLEKDFQTKTYTKGSKGKEKRKGFTHIPNGSLKKRISRKIIKLSELIVPSSIIYLKKATAEYQATGKRLQTKINTTKGRKERKISRLHRHSKWIYRPFKSQFQE